MQETQYVADVDFDQLQPVEDETFAQDAAKREIDSHLGDNEIRVDTTRVNVLDIVERTKELEADKKRAISALLQKKTAMRKLHEDGQKEAEEIHATEQAKLDSHLATLGHSPEPAWVPELKQAQQAPASTPPSAKRTYNRKASATIVPTAQPKRRGRPVGSGKKAATAKAGSAEKPRRTMSDATKKAMSEARAAYWAKRKKAEAKAGKGK